VADDNSNIQKMVALALKDEGIDVVAVGNGDAAMRKIPDLRPDLVLADIFMPVRNGYEVCEFVKSDSRYMSTPVVLLVGAFDPLDEQETQRVHADGVLKKPFVPPDPLINMVKALLAKSNGQKTAPVQTPIIPKAATPPPTAPAPVTEPSASIAPQAAPASALPQHQAEVKPAAQQKPPAFVAPMPPRKSKAPVNAPLKADDTDEVTTAVRDPNLGEPFWAAPVEPGEEPEQKSETQPEDMLDMHSFGKDESSIEEEDHRTNFRPDSPLLSGDFGDDLGKTIVSQNEPITPAPPKYSQPAAEVKEHGPAVTQTIAPEPLPSSAAAEPPADTFKFDPTLTFPPTMQDGLIEEESGGTGNAPIELESTSLETPASEYAGTPSWPAATDSTADAPVNSEKPIETHQELEPIELELPSLPNHEAVITAATEAARLAFSELNTLPGSGASAGNSDRHASVAETDPLATYVGAAPSISPTPEMIEAVVNRLLEHMQPQIMEVVNREVLRPAIEAIVRREMKKN
jgi:CheY-like chemotaxis protein